MCSVVFFSPLHQPDTQGVLLLSESNTFRCFLLNKPPAELWFISSTVWVSNNHNNQRLHSHNTVGRGFPKVCLSNMLLWCPRWNQGHCPCDGSLRWCSSSSCSHPLRQRAGHRVALCSSVWVPVFWNPATGESGGGGASLKNQVFCFLETWGHLKMHWLQSLKLLESRVSHHRLLS